MKELEEYLKRVNKHPANIKAFGGPVGLKWRYTTRKQIEVYEDTGSNSLCFASEENIIRNLKHSLADWDLTDPDEKEAL